MDLRLAGGGGGGGGMEWIHVAQDGARSRAFVNTVMHHGVS
jgi:hypothetical protein